MDLSFGQNVLKESQNLAAAGKDPNQTAGILCSQDKNGANYGIGIVLDGAGKPAPSSATLHNFVLAELDKSQDGTYKNSAKLMADLTKAVLAWQRVPEKYWDQFQLVLPSDAGTGAVITSVMLNFLVNPKAKTLAFEELGWPAYKAIAKVNRVGMKEFPPDGVFSEKDAVVIYQAGPMNTTGQVKKKELVQARAEAAAKNNTPVILDRAYSGFEFAHLLGQKTYDDIMKMSFEGQIEPFIEKKVPFCLALSPTKAFVTFAYRPCGLLLAYSPQPSKELSLNLNLLVRARGSSFEHPVTRAFVKAMVEDRDGLENEHEQALARLQQAQKAWTDLVKGSRMEYLFSDEYAGLFRNTKIDEKAFAQIYNEHLYPVLAKGRCRLNVTGLPSNPDLAKKHVGVFAQHCY